MYAQKVNYDYDDDQENETNSSRYSEPNNFDNGERASFHSAYSQDNTAENEKQSTDLLENNDNPFPDLPTQPVADKTIFEPPAKFGDKGNYRDYPLAQNTYENTYVDRKSSQDFKKDVGQNNQKNVVSMASQLREIENNKNIPAMQGESGSKGKFGTMPDVRQAKKNSFDKQDEMSNMYQSAGQVEDYRNIPLVQSEFVSKTKVNSWQDDKPQKKNSFDRQEEVGSLYPPLGQGVMYQQRELRRNDSAPIKESNTSFGEVIEGKKALTPRQNEQMLMEARKAKEREIELEKERENEFLRELEKQQEKEREREKAEKAEKERQQRLREQEQERERLRKQQELEREKEKQRLKELKEKKEREEREERERLRQQEEEEELEREQELERERIRLQEIEKQREKERQQKLKEQELELERERERERIRQQQELEREKEKQRQRELKEQKEREEREERERLEELEREQERERERLQELQKQKEKEKEKEREQEREKKRQLEAQKLQEEEEAEEVVVVEPPKKVEKTTSITSMEGSKQKNSRKSSMDGSQKGRSMELYDNFVDEDTLYPLKSGRISKTIQTQTNDLEFPSGYVTGLQSERVEISIPETKIVRDGLIYTYLVYKIVTKLKDEEDRQTEFSVFRRYSDFDWLFENITNKYHGYVIPVPPPKNILTAFNKEGVEFSETRKKELVIFLRKCMQHPFLKNTPELNIFLSDERGFLDFKKREQALSQNKAAIPILMNISKMIHGATKAKPYHLREIDGAEGDLYNYEVTFMNIKKRLQSFSTQKLEQIQLQKRQTAALLSFTHKLEDTLGRSKYSKLDREFQKVSSSNISEIEDNAIKDVTEKVENHLKDIISNVDAVIAAIERRNNLAQDLNNMHEAIEEKSLKFKKDFTNGDELEELKKEYERLKKKCQEASEILLKELKAHKDRIDHDLDLFLNGLLTRKEQYFKEVYNLWSQTCQEEQVL